jgi:hypothetical protein
VRDLAVLLLHLMATGARLAGPGGARAVLAESVLVKHQLLILNRSRQRAPNLRPADREVAGLCAVFMRPSRLIRSAIVFKPATLLNLHRALMQRKYRRLFSSKRPMKPGPKGPSQDVIAAVVDMKQRNPSWGVPGSRARSLWPLVFLSIGTQANLRILDVEAIKTVPYVPLSHPFVERLIGTIRRECLDRTLFWTAADLEGKLLDFQRYVNGHRTHAG